MVKTDAERILGDNTRDTAMKDLAKAMVNWLLEQGMFRTCYNCEHWLEGPPDNRLQKCGKFNIRPPTKVIVCGCDQHTDNIPY